MLMQGISMETDHYINVRFLYLPKENEPKENAANHLGDHWSTSLAAHQERAISESCWRSAESLFRSWLFCSAVCNGFV
jgi:hypothetical protein